MAVAGISGAMDLDTALSMSADALGSRGDALSDVEPAIAVAGETGVVSGPANESARPTGPAGTGVWAVVVGVDDYPGSGRDLRAGVADAVQMQSVLDLYGVPLNQRVVLTGGAATRDALVAAFDWLALNAGPDALPIFFFSGHVRQVRGDPDGDGEEVDEVLVLADDGTVTDGEVAAVFNRTPARRGWLAIAGCFAGGFDDAMAPGRLLTGASPEGSLAYESDRFGLTYLVEYMLRRAILEGAAGSSVQEAFGWAVEALRQDYPRRLPVMVDQVGEPLTLAP